MPRKKGQQNAGDSAITSPSATISGDDAVCDCIELVLKPPAKRKSGGEASGDINCIGDDCAILHPVDAHKLDIRDGEPAIIVRANPLSELQNDNEDGLASIICKVRTSPTAPTNRSSPQIAAPVSTKRKSSQDVAACGHVILSPSLYEQLSPSAVDDTAQSTFLAAKTTATLPPSAATKNASYTSPSKSNFSFSKGGGVDAYQSAKSIIETLAIAKCRDAFIQRPGSDKLETISISFRGKKETFRIVGVASDPGPQTTQTDITASFDRLAISGNKQNESWLLKLLQSEKEIAYRVTPRTTIELVSSHDNAQSTSPETALLAMHENQTQAEDRALCAGLDATLSRIKDALLPPLLHPDLFPADGPLRPPKGALLFGPAGVGKSLLAAQIAHELSLENKQKLVEVRLVQCADILSSTAIVGEGEKLLTDVFREAEQKALTSQGSLVILDDVHLICPRRGGVGSAGLGVDQLAGTLLALLDGIGSSDSSGPTSSKPNGGLVVLAITTDPGLLDPALRRPGRLDVEVEVPVPDDEARADILSFHLSQLGTQPHLVERDIKTLARLAKGFTGADCKLAVKEALRTVFSRCQQSGSVQSTAIEYQDLEHAIRITKPSAIKSVAVEVPKVPWSAIGGMDRVKALLKESIELPLTHPHLFEMMQVPPPKGVLLYGPPGCSKTLMARAIATEGNMNFLAVKGPELLSKWLGESERALASLFRRARLASPAVIFFDEVDAIASKRGDSGGSGGDRLLSQLLTELDGVTSGGSFDAKAGRVVVVGATNRPDVLDAALTRPGRMDRMIYVGLPDEQGRKSIFEIGLSGKDCHEDVDVSALASDEVSNGYSGAEIIALCKDAALHAIGEMDDGGIDQPQIHMRHLLRSIDDMKPRTTKEMLHFYDSFRGRH
ncbi:hypothetical protein ACHAXT_001038 [Thalassiosira profunda]